MNVALLITALLVFSGLAYFWLGTRRAEEDEPHFVTRCPACDQKVRYFARHAGGAGLCPRCLKQVRLPRTPRALSQPRRPYRVGERVLARVGGSRSSGGDQRSIG